MVQHGRGRARDRIARGDAQKGSRRAPLSELLRNRPDDLGRPMPTGWQILHVPDGVRGRDRRRLRGLLAALHALRRFARPKRPIPRRSAARRPLTAHFRPFCWPFGGISLSPAHGQGRALFCTQIFVYGLGCCRASAYALGFGQIAAHGGDLSAQRARARPPMLTLEDWEPIQRPNLTTRRRGRRAPQGADGAHGAASGARTARGREADRRDSGDARARAPRATDRAAGAGHESAPPVPRYNFRSGANPAGVSPTGGRGERP